MTVGGQSSKRREGNGTQQRHGWRAPARLGRLAFLLAVLTAFSWQSFVAQTHQHPGLDPASAAIATRTADAAPGVSGAQSPFDQPASCPICREIAHAGAYLLPTPVTFDAPAPVAFWRADAPSFRPVLAKRSHAWQSRAPPLQLQA